MRPAAGLRHNLGLKLLSIALALLLWSFVHGAKIVDRELSVPIRYVRLPEDVLLVDEAPRQMRVLVSGPAQELALRLRFMRGSEARIDLSRVELPYTRIVPSVSDVAVPPTARLTVVRIVEPTLLTLHLERRVERTVPVRAVLLGEPAAGYELHGTPRVVPGSVRCSGPASVMQNLDEVRTQPVDLSRKRDPFKVRVELAYDRKRLTCVPEEVSVEIELDRVESRSQILPGRQPGGWAGDLAVGGRPGARCGPERRQRDRGERG